MITLKPAGLLELAQLLLGAESQVVRPFTTGKYKYKGGAPWPVCTR